MKKLLLLCVALCALTTTQAQDFPYSKYINFSKSEFEANKFKYSKKYNTWTLSKTNGWNEAFNILAIIADAYEEVRPSYDDYIISAQMGDNDMVSYVYVEFYNDEIYHKILTFLVNNCSNIIETSSGKLVRKQATYNGYELELNMEQIISRTSAYTADPHTLKNVDESYNEYSLFIRTDVPAQSKFLDKLANKKSKRQEKGRKMDLEDMM